MLGLLFFRGVCVCLAESRFYSAPQVFFCVGHSSCGLIYQPLRLFFDPIVYEGSSDILQECHASLVWDGELFHVRVHSSVQAEVKEEGFAFLPVAVEFLGWIASQLSCECRWPCWGSTASCGDSSSASTSSSSWDGLDRKARGDRCGCGGLCLGASHGVGCEDLWGGCNVLPFVGGIFRVS